jgi:murein DD-endopeptidase MepM/ murein hydrolase activator NlpD
MAVFRLRVLVPLVIAENCDKIVCSRDTQDEDAYLNCNKEKQACLERKIKEAQDASITLTNTINIINGEISLQQLQIEQTISEINKLEKEIKVLTDRINGLGLSLDRLTNILIERVQADYKQKASSLDLTILVKEKSLNKLIANLYYLRKAEEQTARAMQLAETQRLTYHEQKTLKEEKQTELEGKKQVLEVQQNTLTKRKQEQQYLLQETQNNEARYQQELAKTLGELKAIQSIIAGRGTETKVKDVKEGEKIASIIAGASACSTGTHLHFEIVKDGAHRDPASYLKSESINWDNSPDGPFGFSGSWQWPVNNAARVTQGYGMTYYARVKRYYGGLPHSGIDLVSKTSSDYTVKAVREGELYRGSIACGGGYLRYVKVKHKEDGISTYYLHVNY